MFGIVSCGMPDSVVVKILVTTVVKGPGFRCGRRTLVCRAANGGFSLPPSLIITPVPLSEKLSQDGSTFQST